MNVGLVVLPGCWDSGVTTVMDVLRVANVARRQVARNCPEIRVRTVSMQRSPVETAGGLIVPADLTPDDDQMSEFDVLVVPALGPSSPLGIIDALGRDDVRAAGSVLRAWVLGGGQVAAACTGTFLLAEAGLLDKRRATTSRWLINLFRHRYPTVRLDMSRMVVRDGDLVTAGAAFAHIDLALHLVAQVSPQLSRATATALLLDDRPALSIEAAADHLSSTDHLVMDFEKWVRSNLSREVGVADAALAIGTTRRTLERRVRETVGTTPYALIRRLRIEQARHLRRTTSLTLDEIAPLVGYRSASTLRTILTTPR